MSIQRSLVVLMYITLVAMSLLKELVNHERMDVFALFQASNNGDEKSGIGNDPFTKPNLFLPLKDRKIALAQVE